MAILQGKNIEFAWKKTTCIFLNFKNFIVNCFFDEKYSAKSSAGRAAVVHTTVTEVKFHYFRGRGITTAVAVKFFSSISEWIWQF